MLNITSKYRMEDNKDISQRHFYQKDSVTPKLDGQGDGLPKKKQKK